MKILNSAILVAVFVSFIAPTLSFADLPTLGPGSYNLDLGGGVTCKLTIPGGEPGILRLSPNGNARASSQDASTNSYGNLVVKVCTSENNKIRNPEVATADIMSRGAAARGVPLDNPEPTDSKISGQVRAVN